MVIMPSGSPSSSSPPSPQSLPIPLPPRFSPSAQCSQPRTPSPPNKWTKKSLNNVTYPPPPHPAMSKRETSPSQTSVSTMSVREVPSSHSIVVSTPNLSTWEDKPMPTSQANQDNSSEKRNEVEDGDEAKPRLKPLHWDKVRASSDRATVWDQMKSSSFQLDEDMIESIFGCNAKNPTKKELSRRSTLPTIEQENRVLDPKKSQNIAILLRALNVTREEVTEALLDGFAGYFDATLYKDVHLGIEPSIATPNMFG